MIEVAGWGVGYWLHNFNATESGRLHAHKVATWVIICMHGYGFELVLLPHCISYGLEVLYLCMVLCPASQAVVR
jgi:hypothetical protein